MKVEAEVAVGLVGGTWLRKPVEMEIPASSSLSDKMVKRTAERQAAADPDIRIREDTVYFHCYSWAYDVKPE